MEGPGGYQFVGRTTQVWNHRHPERSGPFEDGTPWLLRFFDRISWYPVEPDELLELRAETAARLDGLPEAAFEWRAPVVEVVARRP